ncbi:hypothetical protein KUA23_15420 [Pseudomonas pergaminensis]|uniref:Peptidase C58 YopT-type domain-containing protein n=1 Tax=Pseudomonas pergaminensis TaxID=2853159 RepID=A0ABD7T9T1_9PSED|nr:hypothetical protein [Pseudomonas pergaminensis]USV98485.1 hypothetical protein KUA23_15420 [Pseudomonas pergaminensis]
MITVNMRSPDFSVSPPLPADAQPVSNTPPRSTPALQTAVTSRPKRAIQPPVNASLQARGQAVSPDNKNVEHFTQAVLTGLDQQLPLFREQKRLNPPGMTQEQVDQQFNERIANLLQVHTMEVEPSSTYAQFNRLGAGDKVTLKQFIQDHGWNLPTDFDALKNLLSYVRRAPLPTQTLGDYGGAMSWLQPPSHEQLLAVYYHPVQALELPADSELFGLLTRTLRLSEAEAAEPGRVISALINSPAAQEVGRVMRAKVDAGSTPGSDTDWLLAGLQVSLDRESLLGSVQPPPRNRVAGFDLDDSRFWGQPASTVVAGLTEHLMTRSRASEAMAPAAAHLLLARKAPQFLVRDIPPGVVYGSHSWVSLCTAVARIEAQSPGSVATMSYAQVMAFDDIAPVTRADQRVAQQAQDFAIIDWAVCRGILPASPTDDHSPAQMSRIRKAFDEEVLRLSRASVIKRSDIPDRKQMTLDWLKETFGADTDYEKKCIYRKPRDKDEPGPYSVVDLAVEGKLLDAPQVIPPRNAFRAAPIPRVVTAQWASNDPGVPIAQIVNQAKTLNLPDFNQQFETKVNEHLDQLEISSFDAIVYMLTQLPLKDREFIEYGKVEVYREELIHHQSKSLPDWRRGQPDGQKPLLVRAQHEDEFRVYEVNPNQHKIIRRPDLEKDFPVGHRAFEYRFEVHPRPLDDDKISVTTYADIPADRRYIEKVSTQPEDAQLFAEQRDTSGVPQTYHSDRTFRIAQLVRDNMYDQVRKKIVRETRGLTTFESEIPPIRKIREFITGLIPLYGAITKFNRGDVDGGIQDLFFDTLGFGVAGASAAGRVARAVSGVGSTAAKAWSVGRILGRSAVGALSPIPGVEDAVASVGRASAHRFRAVINQVRGTAGHYDVFKASRAYDAAAMGVYKVNGDVVQGIAVLHNGKWHAYSPAGGQRAVDDFTPSLRATDERLQSWQGAAPALSEPSRRIRENFRALEQKLRNGPSSTAFNNGYNAGDPYSIKGFSSRLNAEQVMKLAQTDGLTAAQVGALVRQRERLAVQHAFSGVQQAQSLIDAAGGTFTANPQLFYLSQVDSLSQGQCAALSKIMASALEQGKGQTLIENMFSAAAKPTHPASVTFTKTLQDVQKQVSTPAVFHAGNPVRQVSHDELIAELGRATTSTTLMIGSPGHAMMAGVKVDGVNKQFFFYDPNLGLATFPTQSAMNEGLQALFTQKKPATPYRTYSTHPDKLEFRVSTHDEGWTSKASVHDGPVKQLYEAPIDTSTTQSGQQLLAGSPLVPEKVYVPVTESAQRLDANSILYTRGISDCTALVVLTDLKDGIYHKRTLIHLQGGVADPAMLPLLKQLDASLANGGKVIFVGGDNARSAQGLASSLKQTLGDQQPLLSIINRQPQSTVIATASGIDIKPDGTFELIEGGYPPQVLDAAMKKQVYDRID